MFIAESDDKATALNTKAKSKCAPRRDSSVKYSPPSSAQGGGGRYSVASASTDGACNSSAGERDMEATEILLLEDRDVLLALSRFMDKRYNILTPDARKAIRGEAQRRHIQLPSRSASSDGQGVEAGSPSDRPPSY